ncbi:MAG: hypothetical protein HKN02_13630 [Rhodobacteraceae bacterium]|nr:hypothetical protein [Paracoccaceae bacterium]
MQLCKSTMLEGLLAFLLGVAPACAAPVLVDYQSITPKSLEDFESYAPGDLPSGALFDGFSFSATAPLISATETVCRSAGLCLTADDLLGDKVRVFSGFKPGTKAFGAELSWVNPQQQSTLQVIVEGKKETQLFGEFGPAADLVSALGFFDQSGLKSVTFIIGDLPGPFATNYGFDNVITAVRPVGPTPVPLASAFGPAGVSLAGLGLAALARKRKSGAVRRRSKRS